MNNLKKYLNYFSYLIPLLIAGIFFRNLEQYSLWHDEFKTWITVSQVSFSDFLATALGAHAGPPLYYLILWIFNPFIEWTEINLRIFSALFSLGTLFCFFHLIKKQVGLAAAVGFCLLMATNDKILYFSQEARPYSLLGFLVGISMVLYFEMLEKKNSFSRLGFFLFVNIGILYTHYYGVVYVISLLLMLQLYSKSSLKKKFIFTAAWGVAFIPIVAFFGLRDYKKSMNFLEELSFGNLDLPIYFFDSPRINLTIFISCLVALIFNIRKNGIQMKHVFLFKMSGLFLSTYFLVYLVGFFKPVYTPRYLFFTLPIYYGLIVTLLQTFFEEILTPIKSETTKNYSVAALVLIITIFFSYFPILTAVSESSRIPLKEMYPIREAYAKIRSDNTPEDKFIILDDAADNSFHYYNKGFPKNTLFFMGCSYCDMTEKIEWLNIFLNSNVSKSYYFVKVSYQNKESLDGYLAIESFEKKIILDSGNIVVIKYTSR